MNKLDKEIRSLKLDISIIIERLSESSEEAEKHVLRKRLSKAKEEIVKLETEADLKKTERKRRKRQGIIENVINPAKSESWKNFKDSPQRVCQATHAYHWLRVHGPACQAEYEVATNGKQGSICRTFNDLENKFEMIRPIGLKKNPHSDQLVTFYEALEIKAA